MRENNREVSSSMHLKLKTICKTNRTSHSHDLDKTEFFIELNSNLTEKQLPVRNPPQNSLFPQSF